MRDENKLTRTKTRLESFYLQQVSFSFHKVTKRILGFFSSADVFLRVVSSEQKGGVLIEFLYGPIAAMSMILLFMML